MSEMGRVRGSPKTGGRVAGTLPGNKAVEHKIKPESLHLHPDYFDIGLPLRIDKTGEWSFQLISALGGSERLVGEQLHLTIGHKQRPHRKLDSTGP
jgi:hypothetical protein